MSQMEPYDYSQFPQPFGDDDFDETMQMRSGSTWQPGWRPPSQQRPGCGPWPPGPGAGGWPFWGYWGFRLRSAWRDVKFLNKLITDILYEQIDNGIIAPGPNYVPPSGTTPTPTPGVKGVTDGSDAGPGMVGEFVRLTSVVSYAANAVTDTTVSLGVIQPGDWDLSGGLDVGDATGPTSIYLNPMPTGMSNRMHLAIGQQSTANDWNVLAGATARASVSVPTLLPFRVYVNMTLSPTMPAGTATLWVEGRRIR